MLITVAEVNAILNISGKDDVIAGIIPFAESFAIDYCKNPFHISDQMVESYDISFQSAAKKIVTTSDLFISDLIHFQPGLHIHVQHSILNDGFFLLSAVTINELTVSAEDNLFDETDGALIRIDLVKIPPGFKLSIANFIGYQMKGVSSNLQSESIGDYSYSNRPGEEILSQYFKAYRKVGVV